MALEVQSFFYLPQCRTNKSSQSVSKVLNFLTLLVLKFEMQ